MMTDTPPSPVGAGLLAIAVLHSKGMLAVIPPSPASRLLQGSLAGIKKRPEGRFFVYR
jgi:hypothetical protein